MWVSSSGLSNPFGWFFPQPSNTSFTHMHCSVPCWILKSDLLQVSGSFSSATLSSLGLCLVTSQLFGLLVLSQNFNSLPMFPFLWPWTGSYFKELGWSSCGVDFNLHFSAVTVLCCHSPVSWKFLFYISHLVFDCFNRRVNEVSITPFWLVRDILFFLSVPLDVLLSYYFLFCASVCLAFLFLFCSSFEFLTVSFHYLINWIEIYTFYIFWWLH